MLAGVAAPSPASAQLPSVARSACSASATSLRSRNLQPGHGFLPVGGGPAFHLSLSGARQTILGGSPTPYPKRAKTFIFSFSASSPPKFSLPGSCHLREVLILNPYLESPLQGRRNAT